MATTPAPATARLLMGFPVHRDGIEGERVTPTGAAILRHHGLLTVGGSVADAEAALKALIDNPPTQRLQDFLKHVA